MLLNLLVVDKGSIHASQIVQQRDVARKHGNPHMVAGDAGVMEHQVVGLSPSHTDGGSGNFEDLRLS